MLDEDCFRIIRSIEGVVQVTESIWLKIMYGETMTDRNTQTRRRWLGTCTGVAATTVLAGCFGSDDDTSDENGDNGAGDSDPDEESLGEDWPMYGVDLQNTSYQPNATGPEGDEISVREVYEMENNTGYPVIIVDDRLYASIFGGDVIALDLESEERVWDAEGYGPLMAHDENIYGPRAGKSVYGYDMESGDRWESDEVEIEGRLNLNTDPIPTEHGILVVSDHHVYNIDPESGEYTSVHRYPFDSRDLIGSTDIPAYDDGIFYHAKGVELYALDVESGEHEWTVEEENVLHTGNPAVADDHLYILRGDDHLCAYDTESGDELWTEETDTNLEQSPTVADGVVYVGERTRLIAFEADTGDIKWEENDPEMGEPEEIVVVNDTCYVVTRKRVAAYDTATGAIEWEYQVPDGSDIRFNTPPAVSDGTIYLLSGDETLYAIEDA